MLAIREIIATKDIASQDEILTELTSRGFELTQATLSRDIKELQIAKVPDGMGRYRYRIAPNQVARMQPTELTSGADFIRSCALSIEFSGQMAVLKTRPGYASVVADMVDKSQIDGVMGTLAGDDTVLLVLRTNANNALITHVLSQWIPDIESKIIHNA